MKTEEKFSFKRPPIFRSHVVILFRVTNNKTIFSVPYANRQIISYATVLENQLEKNKDTEKASQ